MDELLCQQSASSLKGWIEIKLDRCLFFSSSFSTNLMIDIHILSCNFSTKDICQTIIHQTVMYVLRSGRLIGQFHFLFSISQYMDRSAENMVKKKKEHFMFHSKMMVVMIVVYLYHLDRRIWGTTS